MKVGVIKFFDEKKGYGYITEEGTGTEIFVHITGLNDKVQKGDRVTFEVQDGRKGPNAVKVQLLT